MYYYIVEISLRRLISTTSSAAEQSYIHVGSNKHENTTRYICGMFATKQKFGTRTNTSVANASRLTCECTCERVRVVRSRYGNDFLEPVTDHTENPTENDNFTTARIVYNSSLSIYYVCMLRIMRACACLHCMFLTTKTYKHVYAFWKPCIARWYPQLL